MINFKTWFGAKKDKSFSYEGDDAPRTITITLHGGEYLVLGGRSALIKDLSDIDFGPIVENLEVTVKGSSQLSPYHRLGSKVHEIVDSGITAFIEANRDALEEWMRDYINTSIKSLVGAAKLDLGEVQKYASSELEELEKIK